MAASYGMLCAMRAAVALVFAVAATGCGLVAPRDTLEIRGVTVIDPASATVIENRCIRIRDDTVSAIADCHAAGDIDTIDAAGMWAVPGLWDMHVHALWHADVYEPFMADFIRFGIVGIRDMGGSLDVLQQARWHMRQTGSIGPHVIAAGPFLDGPDPINPTLSLRLASYQDGVAAVATIARRGADFVKLYTLLPADAALGAMAEARRRGLPVVGHLPATLDLDVAIANGMQGIEHMAVELGGLCDVDDPGDECRDVFGRINAAGVALTPTLIVRKRRTELDQPQILHTARVTQMPAVVADDWLARRDHALATEPRGGWDDRRRQFAHEQALTRRAIESGSLILAGTDAGDLFVPPGDSLHDELALLVAAGMSEMQALRAATADATAFLGMSDRGRLRPGAKADLLVLHADPLLDIHNTRAIEFVIVDGRVVWRATPPAPRTSTVTP